MNIDVLDKGFVRQEISSLSDTMVVRAARVSFGNVEEPDEATTRGLIGFLMRNRHGTPFEHGSLTVHVKAPIFVFREWHRHRVGWSYNEWSGRYSQLAAEWYTPAGVDIRHQVGKPGAYVFEAVDDDRVADVVRNQIDMIAREAFQAYEGMLTRGIAKEVARMVLPVNTYSQMYATCNPRSLMNFLSLRNSELAQMEIRRYAEALEEIFAAAMPVTHAAFIDNGRVAP